ncbi:hypothetical protein [Nocardia brasiliensis]|uniref:hypothetical protein n=1 Tax=Nocardia brasiliensis TaxID=37326 RepID=UPI0024543A36|nr:hypothetical protein [Nocardia brasiliensis]
MDEQEQAAQNHGDHHQELDQRQHGNHAIAGQELPPPQLLLLPPQLLPPPQLLLPPLQLLPLPPLS